MSFQIQMLTLMDADAIRVADANYNRIIEYLN
nr:MAG TPA: hypothetical protein [Caudoviricetes sp.]